MATRSNVVKIARSQIGVKESPRNSNRQKYGKAYGMNGVFWCAQFVWWCYWMADGKKNLTVAKASSADTIQDLTVRNYGGTYVMKKTKSSATRQAYTKKAQPGDIVSFDFGAMDAWRDHVGLVDHVEGDYIYCIEGNTTPDGQSGSQSNGGMVALKKRHYKAICCAVRPRYDNTPAAKYTGKLPTLPKRGWFQVGDKGSQVVLLQKFLIWAGFSVGKSGTDGDYGNDTKNAVRAFQMVYGLSVDGGWGSQCQSKAKAMCK